MDNYACLSLMELLDLRDDTQDAELTEAREHLEKCPRCRVLFARLPDVAADEIEITLPASVAPRPRPTAEEPDEVGAGQLWLATAPNVDDWRFPVAVIGRPRQRPGTIIVAPVDEDLAEATDADLIVEDSPLGYRHLLNVWNFGFVLTEQLEEYMGSLDEQATEALRSLYRAVATGEGEGPETVGTALGQEDDPRWRHRDERARWTRALFATTRTEEATDAAAAHEQGKVILFSRYLERAFESHAWDEATLLEEAQLPQPTLERFLHDRLDVVHQADVEPLARTLVVLDYDLDEVKEPLWNSLAASGGGWLRASEGSQALAARSWANVGEEERFRDLYAGGEEVDVSEEGRARAIASYWAALVETYEELRPR